ncbi:hypothetical protein CR513_38993, partial [Mucuna pruriens]
MFCIVYYGRVHFHYRSMQGVALGEEILVGAWFCSGQILSAIYLGKNSTFHSRSKHINVRYHWIRDAFDAKLLELAKVHTDNNGVDMMTKALPRRKFEAETLTAGSTHIVLHLNSLNLDLEVALRFDFYTKACDKAYLGKRSS